MKRRYRIPALSLLLPLVALSLACERAPPRQRAGTAPASEAPLQGSVIFLHPDGAALAAWGAARLLVAGPDGMLNWDRLERMGAYRGHLSDAVGSSSHGGATTHAYGVKVPYESYGMWGDRPLTAHSGKPMSIMEEARQAGLATGLVNTGHIAEPGTGAFAASVVRRDSATEIAERVIESGAEVLLSGGEDFLLPAGVPGRHGGIGVRRDGRNLIERARELGYTVVFTREELLAVSPDTRRLLGIFAPGHTFNDATEEALRAAGLPAYRAGAPTIAEMMEAALRVLGQSGRSFLLVAEEEGTDNFGNANNAAGTLEALRRADDAIGVAVSYIEANPETLLITAADSDAGGLGVLPLRAGTPAETPLPAATRNGAPVDGRYGTGTPPFIAAPDRSGARLAFGIAWAGREDLMGGVIARAHGLNAARLPSNVDNTEIYRLMYATLFGVELP